MSKKAEGRCILCAGFDEGQEGQYYSDEEDFLGSDDEEDEPAGFQTGLPRLPSII